MAADDSSSNIFLNTPSPPSPSRLPTPSHTLQTTHIHHLISVKLDRHNYLLWRTQFIPLLKGYDLKGYVDGTIPCPPRILSAVDTTINPAYLAWQKQDQVLLGWLLSSLSETVLAQVVGLTSTRAVWQTLEKHYASRSRARIMQIRREIQTMRKGSLSMAEYFLRAKKLADNLAASGQPMLDTDLQQIMLSAFLQQQPVANVANRTRPPQYSQQSAHTNRGRSSNYRGRNNHRSGHRTPSNSHPIGPCQLCGRKNHSASTCWHRFDQAYHPTATAPPSPATAYVATPHYPSDLNWYPDSGATSHVTNDLSNLQIHSDYDGPNKLHVGNGSSLPISHTGNLEILPHVSIACRIEGCLITFNISGNVKVGEYAAIIASSVVVSATNLTLNYHSSINTTSLGGPPPSQTSGTPIGNDGAGGGHGGRGASCLKTNLTNFWGGDVYAWSTLTEPWSYGSKGGSTSAEKQFGGNGGGRVMLKVKDVLYLNGSVNAEGGEGGLKGGGGSGGSIIVNALKLKGTGTISAAGGKGWGGGGGGRILLDCYSIQEDVKVTVHGGESIGCPGNAGAAGTSFDATLLSLRVGNDNVTTQTETPLLDFPTTTLWSNVFVENNAKVLVPLLWTRIQIVSFMSSSILK
ncbi:hypothetical protein HHK36_028126 [Tetracentron sinense]|uniref:Retrotransposon Copia-like N-terminal domain-containing protein n=1 Tax=Tetracentron sinense TaxID=13715 RepID=A0A835D1U5_TETSI|nr:hypothetical protein HHK36_028126 [Tetracentron sinense]